MPDIAVKAGAHPYIRARPLVFALRVSVELMLSDGDDYSLTAAFMSFTEMELRGLRITEFTVVTVSSS